MSAPRFDIRRLLDPSVFPWPVDEVRLIETHISWVLLAGDRVVKLKRPVDLGFVDFRDPAKRKQACEDEVRLNRRLTDGVYLSVVPVTANGVDAAGEPLEWATLMRRMPSERMLDVLLKEGIAPANLAELLANRLIPFHQSLSRALPPSSRAKPRDLSLPEHPAPDLRDSGRGNSLWLPLLPGRTAPSATSGHVAPESHTGDRETGNKGAHGETPLPLSAPSRSVTLPPPTVILNEVKDLSRSDAPETLPSFENPSAHERGSGQARGEILRSAQNDSLEDRGEPEAGLRATRGPSTSLGMTVRRMTGGGCPADPDVYLTVLTDNLDQVATAAGDILGKEQLRLVDRSMREFMVHERSQLDARFEHWLIEGHGDLRCEHICLESNEMQIYDCVEFEIAIRCADVASDLAFLLMDLHRLGARPVADELLERYRAAGFELPQPVVELYAAHRALVRAKVAALERSGSDPRHDLARAFEAATYLDLATAFATPIVPLLVLVSGLSGSGKSTVAAAIGRATGGAIFASDRVRKELAGLEATDAAQAEWHQGIYSDDWTARTYDRLLELTIAELRQGRTAIVDATFLDNAERERFVAAAHALGMPAAIVWTELDDTTARTRIERRARERRDPSDAGIAIRERQQNQLREMPLRIPEGAIAVTIDTGRDGPASLDPFVTALRERGLIGELRREQVAGHA